MTYLQLKQVQINEADWDRALLALYFVIQITGTVLFYLNDSQSGFIILAIITTAIKSIILGAVTIETLRFADRLLKKYWLYKLPSFQ
ncbi:MAG: hypothetical protein OQK78_06460 [Gammaproteobacteria bacterium]|nr:hypothetical protein [Gammaproteobacteria bacterium]